MAHKAEARTAGVGFAGVDDEMSKRKNGFEGGRLEQPKKKTVSNRVCEPSKFGPVTTVWCDCTVRWARGTRSGAGKRGARNEII